MFSLMVNSDEGNKVILQNHSQNCLQFTFRE